MSLCVYFISSLFSSFLISSILFLLLFSLCFSFCSNFETLSLKIFFSVSFYPPATKNYLIIVLFCFFLTLFLFHCFFLSLVFFYAPVFSPPFTLSISLSICLFVSLCLSLSFLFLSVSFFKWNVLHWIQLNCQLQHCFCRCRLSVGIINFWT